MKPSALKGVHPWNSVDQRSEHESHMCWLIALLARTGDTFRQLSYEEYQKEGGKDTEKILEHFNRYIKTEDTICLYSPSFQDKYNQLTTAKTTTH